MSLPRRWVDKLFEKITVTYGQPFLRQYEGIDLDAVKENWGEELSCYQQNPGAIRYGLEMLPPDRAPTVLQFRDLCRRAPVATPALEAPVGEPVSPEAIAATKTAFKRLNTPGDKDWARKLRAREAQGPGLTKYQRDAWREAIGMEAV